MNILIPLPKEPDRPLYLAKGRQSESVMEKKELIYTVKKGDTLWSIANELGVNIGALSRENRGVSETKLIPGDRLKIRLDNGTSEIPREDLGRTEILYVVKKGDTLWDIARRYQLSVSEIKKWNGLDGSDRIYPDEKLKLRINEPSLSIPH